MTNDYGEKVDPVGFGEAIGICFKKFFVFEGRAKESEFWYFFLFQLGGSIITYAIHPALNLVFQLITFFPYFAVGCRRLHDINKSGWWQLIELTIIGILLIIIWCATEGENKKNKYGSPIKIKSRRR